MSVLNLEEAIPGRGAQIQIQHLHRTRALLAQLARGETVPELVVHPQLHLPVGPPPQLDLIGPDYMVLDPQQNIYVPGEEKSFIVRNNIADPSDLDGARRQAAAQVLALRAEATEYGLGERVINRVIFVFATPYGLSPSQPVEEELEAEVFEISRAVTLLREVRMKLATLRNGDTIPLEQLAAQLPTHFQERCLSACALARVCKQQHQGTATLLGDSAADLLGGSTAVDRLIALLQGAPPANTHEQALAGRLIDAAAALGYTAHASWRSA